MKETLLAVLFTNCYVHGLATSNHVI